LLTLLIGFALVVSAINIYKRKRRAFLTVLCISCFSIFFHLTKGLDYGEALFSLFLVIILILTRHYFTVKSSTPSIRWGLLRFVTAAALALSYGIAGFWFLERREFGINFTIGDAIRETLLYLTIVGDPQLVPQTRYAAWFQDSLYLMTATAIVYALYSVFRPVVYMLQTLPRERDSAKKITEKHGRSSLDFFKFWPDKSFFFSPTRASFIAYGVGNNFAIALADPVGPEEELETIIGGFKTFCDENDWGVCFHQTLPDFLHVYERAGFKRIKVGDDAIVDLTLFTLEGKEKKAFRHTINKIEEADIQFIHHEPPIADEILSQLKEVSDEWLKIPGRRERQFTLGTFEPDYIKSTPLFTAADPHGTILAFINQIPSYCAGEATCDLMRRRTDAPNGVMDYLFIKLFLYLKDNGFQRFNVGMAPMSGFQENEEASIEEKAIHYFFQHLNFLFSYRGLRQYKAKFASFWEPRYTIYKSVLDLPKIALALREISELRG
jgi:phosphatidylglycerol lysyltransferase